MNGILIIDKPAGLTSHDVVSRLRRILQTKKIGHTGTLDPFATGVLVMLVGKATRLAKFLDKDEKSYAAIVRFGFETDTGDRMGELRATDHELRNLSVNEIEAVLPEFTGEIEQVPPMYSAKKVKGKKLYELARKGVEIKREPVNISVKNLEITNCEVTVNDAKGEIQDFELNVTCSAGTYIRTLAEDIGKKVGVPCHLAELRRTKAGRFEVSQAVTIEGLEEIVKANELNKFLISMNEAISHLPKVVLNTEEVELIKNGRRYYFDEQELTDQQAVRMIDAERNLIAVGYVNSNEKFIQPRIVMV